MGQLDLRCTEHMPLGNIIQFAWRRPDGEIVTEKVARQGNDSYFYSDVDYGENAIVTWMDWLDWIDDDIAKKSSDLAFLAQAYQRRKQDGHNSKNL